MTRKDSALQYQTPTEIVERGQKRLRAALWWALPAFALGLVGLGVAFLGSALKSHALGIVGFSIGVVAVAFGAGAVVRVLWVIGTDIVSRK